MINLNPTLTAAGFALFRGQSPGFSVAITHVAFGAQKYDPLGFESSLKSELVRFPIDGSALISPSAIQVGVLMKNAAPDGRTANDKWIGEIGFYAGDTLFAVLSQAAAYLFYKSPDIDIPVTYVLDFSVLPAGSITVNNDAQSASIALASSYAQAAAKTALNAQQVISSTYYGPFAAEPTARPDGTARQPGDRYFDTKAKAEKTWSGTDWYAANLNAAILASKDGAASVGATWFGGVLGKLSDLATAAGSGLVGFVQGGVDAVARSIQDKLREQYDVRDYGEFIAGGTSAAVGKINLATLNRAILAVSNAGGGILRLPPGTFVFSALPGSTVPDRCIVLRRNVELRGCGEGITVLRRNQPSTLMTNAPNGAVNMGYGGGENNVGLRDLTLDGNAAYSALYPANISYWFCSDHIRIRRVTFLDTPGLHAIDMNGCRDAVIEKCSFKGQNAELTAVFSPNDPNYFPEAIQLAGETNGYTIEALAPKKIKVIDCYFGPSETQGSHWVAVGNHALNYNVQTEDVLLRGNIIDNPLRHGFRPFAWKRTKIIANTFIGGSVGITLSSAVDVKDSTGTPTGFSQSGEDMLIALNHFKDVANECVSVSAGHVGATTYQKWRNLAIINNTVTGKLTTCTPFNMRWVSRLTISGNNLNGDFYRGIYMRFCDAVRVTNNHIENTNLEALLVVEEVETAWSGTGLTADYVISGNSLVNTGYSGMNLQAIVGGTITGNTGKNLGSVAPGKRPFIGVSAFCKNLDITGNQAAGGTYVVDVSASCADIRVGPNNAIGMDSGTIRNLATGNSATSDMTATKGSWTPYSDNLDSFGSAVRRYAQGFFFDLRVRNNLPVLAVVAQAYVSASVTGTTDETVLATVKIPAGLLGPNDMLEISAHWGFNNNANIKTPKIKLAGVAYYQPSITTSLQALSITQIRNANSQTAQIGGVSSAGVQHGIGSSGAALATSAINMAQEQTLTFTGTLANAADNITLLGYTVKYVPAP